MAIATQERRVGKLEEQRGGGGRCPLCNNQGRLVVQRAGAPTPPGCPGCGRAIVLVVERVPTRTGQE